MAKPDDEADRRRRIAELAEMIRELPDERRTQLMNELETEQGEDTDGGLPKK